MNRGKIIKATAPDGTKRYDFQFVNKRGHKTTIEGLSDKFNPEYWNYAKLISGVLRYGMPIDQVLKLVAGLELDSQSIEHMEDGCGARAEEVCAQRYSGQRAALPQLRRGDAGVPRRMPDLHLLRHLEVRLTNKQPLRYGTVTPSDSHTLRHPSARGRLSSCRGRG